MTEHDFKQALAPFTSKGLSELAMTDDLAQLGVDSIGVLELTMNIEDEIGSSVEITDALVTVQDLYDCVAEAATPSPAA